MSIPVIARFSRVSDAQFSSDAADYPIRLNCADIPLPRRATMDSAGYDIVCPVEVTIAPGETKLIPTGIRVQMQPGWFLLVCPRSSLGRKYGLRLANTVGVIDRDYYDTDNEGHILVPMTNGGRITVTLHPGDRFCQGILSPFGLAEEEETPGKRTGGFGSTGT